MPGVVAGLSMVVILVTAASANAIGKVIWVNSLFVICAAVYTVLHFKDKTKTRVSTISSIEKEEEGLR